MKSHPLKCSNCGTDHEFTLVVPQDADDSIQLAERLAICPRCDAPGPPPPPRPM